jgi:4-oxalocrotonate tautomerase
MPLARIEIQSGKPISYRQSLVAAVRRAFMDTLHVPEISIWIRVCERKPENFATPPDRDENAVLIEISLFPGRSGDLKRALCRTIVDNFASDPGVPPDDVCIVLYEPPVENWFERGGTSAVDQSP